MKTSGEKITQNVFAPVMIHNKFRLRSSSSKRNRDEKLPLSPLLIHPPEKNHAGLFILFFTKNANIPISICISIPEEFILENERIGKN
jgi:hypothetical protein